MFKTRTPASEGEPAAGVNGGDSGSGSSGSVKSVPEVGEDNGEMSPTGFTELKPKGSPGLLRKSPRVSPPARKSRRSRAGRVRQRRYVRSPKVNLALAGPGAVISPSKPKSPDRSKDGSALRKESASTPGGTRVIQDISSFIVEGADDAPPALPPRNPKKAAAGSTASAGVTTPGASALMHTRSDDSLEVSWSKQLAQNAAAAPARPKSQESFMVGADPLEESHPPRVKLPVIGKKAAKK